MLRADCNVLTVTRATRINNYDDGSAYRKIKSSDSRDTLPGWNPTGSTTWLSRIPGCAKRKLERWLRGESCRRWRLRQWLFSNIGIMYRRYVRSDIPVAFITSPQLRHPRQCKPQFFFPPHQRNVRALVVCHYRAILNFDRFDLPRKHARCTTMLHYSALHSTWIASANVVTLCIYTHLPLLTFVRSNRKQTFFQPRQRYYIFQLCAWDNSPFS